MNAVPKLLIVSMSAFLLFGCASNKPAGSDGAPVTEGGASSSGTDGGSASGDAFHDPSSALYKQTVYFGLDSSDVNSEDRDTVSAHARYLADHGDENVTLEGNTDERGSREYNLALGERRANSVRQLLTAEGASGSQVKTISYGEEKPAQDGHDEDAWQYNRRVEFVYPNHPR